MAVEVGSEWCAFRDGMLEVVHQPKSVEEWATFRLPLSAMRRNLPFWIGDWMNLGKALWPTTYTQMLDIDEWGYADQTIANYASICASVPPYYRRAPHRRVPPLTFSHASVVAKLAVIDQSKWLALAAREGWSHSQLADAISGSEAANPEIGFDTLIERAIKAARKAKERAPEDCGPLVEDALGYLEQAKDVYKAQPVGAPPLVSVSVDALR